MKNSSTIAWICIGLGLLAWGGVIFFLLDIQGEESARAVELQSAQQSSSAQYSSADAHAIVEDTAPERTELQGLLSVDVVTVANMLTGVGRTAGVALKLSGALPENAPAASGATSLQAIGFAIEANGTFSSLMKTAQLLETLPIPASVERLDLQHAQSASGAAGDQWQMNVDLRVLTTANISS